MRAKARMPVAVHGLSGFDSSPWRHGSVTCPVVPPDSRFCDECRWNYTLPRSRCGFESRRLHHLGGRSSMAEHENTFHHSCRRIFSRQRMPWVLHWVAGSSPAPATGSSVGRANVPITSSLHGGWPPASGIPEEVACSHSRADGSPEIPWPLDDFPEAGASAVQR